MSESISINGDIYKLQTLSLFAVTCKNGKKGHLFSHNRGPGGQSKEQRQLSVKLPKSSVKMKSAHVPTCYLISMKKDSDIRL
jgi:hypothetical protein